MTIRLLPASIDTPPTGEVNSQSTSLVVRGRGALPTQVNSQVGVSDLNDNYVWSVAEGDGGSYTFYAVPRQGSGNGASSGWQDSGSGRVSDQGWRSSQIRNAAAMYAFYANISSPFYVHAIDVYA